MSSIIKIDLVKAKDIHRTYIRNSRKDRLAELDVEFMLAQESDDSTKKTEIATKKQALRDAPADSAIDAATDVDSLKAQWNTSILGESPYS